MHLYVCVVIRLMLDSIDLDNGRAGPSPVMHDDGLQGTEACRMYRPTPTSCACSGEAVKPVPMAHTGSYAMTTCTCVRVFVSSSLYMLCSAHTSHKYSSPPVSRLSPWTSP